MTDEEAFTAALPITDPAERAAFLLTAYPNPAQRARVEVLLAAHAAASAFLEPGARGSANTEAHRAGHAPADVLALLGPSQREGALGRIGHYDVLDALGKGGFGIVYRAFDEKLQRVVAVKVLLPHLAATSPARKRFAREARASAAIRHENVVQVYDVGEEPQPYLVMEFIPGETLQQRLDRTGPLDPTEAAEIGRQLAEGLAAAHAQGLIHRDVKPANVLIERGAHPRAKLTDFGLARAADDATATQSGIAGTPAYMSPEQARGEALDTRSDLFALGSVLYALCTGHPPFRAANTVAVLKRVCDDAPRPIRELIPEAPAWLCELIEKLHAKTPAERIQTAREVADRLAAGPNAPPVPPVPPVPRPPRRKWARRGVGALACVAALGLCAWAAVTYYEHNFAPVWFHLSVDDPDAQVVIEGEGANVMHNKPDVFRRRVEMYGTLKPGTYKLIVRMGAEDVYHDEIYVDSGRTRSPPDSLLRQGDFANWRSLSLKGTIRFENPSKLLVTLSDTAGPQDAGSMESGSQQQSAGRYRWAARRERGGEVLAKGEFGLRPGRAIRLTVPTLAQLGFADPFPTDGPTRGKAHKLHPGFWHRDARDALVCEGAENAWLFSPRADYTNFELWAEVELIGECDAALVLRAQFDETVPPVPEAPRAAPPGYTIPLTTRADGPNVVRVGKRAIVEARVQGGHCVLRLNGRVIEDAKDANGPRAGHIALQQAGAKGTLKVHRFEVRTLPEE